MRASRALSMASWAASVACPKYIPRVATEAGVTPQVAQTISEHLTKLAIATLRAGKPFRLYRIAGLKFKPSAAVAAGVREIRGFKFKRRATPSRRRVLCRVAQVLERSVLATAPGSQQGQALTPALQGICRALAISIGEPDITPVLVGKVVKSLRNVIIQDLRATGVFVLDGLVKFVRADRKARSAAYIDLGGKGEAGKQRGAVLRKAKGPHRRVYGRVPRWVSNVCLTMCSH